MKVPTILLGSILLPSAILAENFHLKVKVEPNPPNAGQLASIGLGLFSFDRIEVVDWEEVQEAMEVEDDKESPLKVWIISSDFNQIGYREFKSDSFDGRQNRYNLAPVYPEVGRYMHVVKLKLPAGYHPLHGSHLEQAAVLKVSTDGELESFMSVTEAKSWRNNFETPNSIVHYPPSYFQVPDAAENDRRWRIRNLEPVSLSLDPNDEDNERGDHFENRDGLKNRVYSHVAPFPSQYVNEMGDIVDSPPVNEEQSNYMYMLEYTLYREVIMNATFNGTQVEIEKRKKDQEDEDNGVCIHSWEAPPETDISQCIAVEMQLSDCRVCVVDEGEEICATDMQCNGLADVEEVDFVLTRPYVCEEFGGSWFKRFVSQANDTKGDNHASLVSHLGIDEQQKVTGEDGVPRTPMFNEKTICPENNGVELNVYKNGTMTLVHHFEEDGYHQVVARFVLKDGSLMYATFGFLVPIVPKKKLPRCDEDEDDDVAQFGRFGAASSDMILGFHKDEWIQMVKYMLGIFTVVFVPLMLFLSCQKPAEDKKKTE